MAKQVLITGANSGIGYEAVKALLDSAKDYHILVGARSTDKAIGAIDSLKKECPSTKSTMEPLPVDLASDESIEKAFEQVQESPGHLDVLINNAGATFDLEYIHGKTSLRESFMKSYEVNVAGTNVMTHTFIPLLIKSKDPRLLFVAGLSQINQAAEKYFPIPPLPAGWPKKLDFEVIGYRCSKVALNMLMLDWNHKLNEDGIKVWSVAPGMLATNLGGMGPEAAARMGAGPASLGGDILKRVVEGERDADTGKIVSKDGGISRW